MSKKVWIIIIVLLVAAIGVAVFFVIRSDSGKKATRLSTPQGTEMVSDQNDVLPARDTAAVLLQKRVAAAEISDETVQVSEPQWLELPAVTAQQSGNIRTHYAQMQGIVQRNYTLLYDSQTYTSYWVAYPLCHSHMTKGREEIWAYDPLFPEALQTSVAKGYGASRPTENYPKNFYARGHQLPNADRNAVPEMQRQTYYSTNITPQLQNGFNAGIWKQLEEAVRDNVPQSDTLYVVTGASFAKLGQTAQNRQIVNKNDGKSLPVPNYYWKVLLKTRRCDGVVAQASAIGFWLPHDDLKGHNYEDYAVSVDQIEEWTGYDLFVNLTDQIQTRVEACSDWDDFRNF